MTDTLAMTAKELQEADHAFFMIYDPIPQGSEKAMKDIADYARGRKEFSSAELMSDVLLNIPIKSALDSWLAEIPNSGTRSRYKRAMGKIFTLPPLRGALERNCAITTLDQSWAGTVGVYNLISELDIPNSTKGIFLSIYNRFCEYLRINTFGIVDPEESPERKKDYYSALALEHENFNWESFIRGLRSPYDLISEMTFIAAKACKFRVRLVNSRKNALSLDASQLDFENNSITFTSEQSYHFGSTIFFEKSFMEKLRTHLDGRTGIVFRSNRGNPVYSIQLLREFKAASESLPFEIKPPMVAWAGCIAFEKQNNKLVR